MLTSKDSELSVLLKTFSFNQSYLRKRIARYAKCPAELRLLLTKLKEIHKIKNTEATIQNIINTYYCMIIFAQSSQDLDLESKIAYLDKIIKSIKNSHNDNIFNINENKKAHDLFNKAQGLRLQLQQKLDTAHSLHGPRDPLKEAPIPSEDLQQKSSIEHQLRTLLTEERDPSIVIETFPLKAAIKKSEIAKIAKTWEDLALLIDKFKGMYKIKAHDILKQNIINTFYCMINLTETNVDQVLVGKIRSADAIILYIKNSHKDGFFDTVNDDKARELLEEALLLTDDLKQKFVVKHPLKLLISGNSDSAVHLEQVISSGVVRKPEIALIARSSAELNLLMRKLKELYRLQAHLVVRENIMNTYYCMLGLAQSSEKISLINKITYTNNIITSINKSSNEKILDIINDPNASEFFAATHLFRQDLQQKFFAENPFLKMLMSEDSEPMTLLHTFPLNQAITQAEISIIATDHKKLNLLMKKFKAMHKLQARPVLVQNIINIYYCMISLSESSDMVLADKITYIDNIILSIRNSHKDNLFNINEEGQDLFNAAQGLRLRLQK